jgi:hypothetical protein
LFDTDKQLVNVFEGGAADAISVLDFEPRKTLEAYLMSSVYQWSLW